MEKIKKLSSISIFFPCYNEEKNIQIFVKQALELLPSIANKFEIIIVNDGSKDNTHSIGSKLAIEYPQVSLIDHKNNQGYGAALKTGFTRARLDWVFFTDGDLQFDLNQLKEFIAYSESYSVIIGYRKKRSEGFRRNLNAQLFKLYVDLLFRLHVKDIDCAFKLIKKEALNSIDLYSNGAFISSELLYKLKKKGYTFKQLPVNHYPRRFGKPTGSNLKVIMRALEETLLLYLFMKFGLFGKRYHSNIKN